MAVYGSPEGDLNQGDVIAEVPFYVRQDLGVTLVTTPGLVLSHSCDIDKYAEEKAKLDNNTQKRWPVQMAPLYSPATFERGLLGDIHAGRHRRYFHIPKEGRHQEVVADFWLAQPVPLVVVRRLKRLATLSDEYLAKMWTHAFVAISRKNPTETFQGGRLAS